MDSKDNKKKETTVKDSPSSKSKSESRSKAKPEDKVRASRRSKQERAAKDLGRSNHTTASEPGAVSVAKNARRDPKDRKTRRSHRRSSHQSNSGPSPGACSSSRGSSSGKTRDRDRDREAKEGKKGGSSDLSASQHSREIKEGRKGSRPSVETRTNRKTARKTIVADSGPSADNANAASDEVLLQAELIPEEETVEKQDALPPAAVLMETSPTQAMTMAVASPAATQVARPSGPFNPAQAPQGIHDSSDADFEGNRSRNAGLCYRKFWIALAVLAVAGVAGGYFALRPKDDTPPSQDLSISVYLPPSTEDCRAVENGFPVQGQDELTSRSLQTTFALVVATKDTVAELDIIMKAIFESITEYMTCCNENGRRLAHSSDSSMIRGGGGGGHHFGNNRFLQNKDCAVANVEVSVDATNPPPVDCQATAIESNANGTECEGNNQDVDHNEAQTVEVNTNFKFYLKGDEDDDFLGQTMEVALEEGQKDNFGLPEEKLLKVVVLTKTSPSPSTSDPTTAPSTAPFLLPLTMPPSHSDMVPTAAPTDSIPDEPQPTSAPVVGDTLPPTLVVTPEPTRSPTEATPDGTAEPSRSPSTSPSKSPTTSPSKSPTKRPSIAPAPGVTPQPTGTPSLKPSTIPTTNPSMAPTMKPTPSPSESPSITPSSTPTKIPTSAPTASPSQLPSVSPSAVASQPPSTAVDGRRAMVEGILSDEAPFNQQAMDWLVETDSWKPDEGDPDSDYLWLERYALASLYYSTDGDNWTVNTNWLSSNPVCNWASAHGWMTNACPGPIVLLVLEQNNLQGSLPDVITKLNRVIIFLMNYNAITGTIPAFAGDSSLVAFGLGNNQLTGPIPESIGNLGSLTNLALLNNQMSGTIPDTIASLSYLRLLYLRGNSLGETIPTSISQLSNLQRMDMTSTGLRGPLPSFLSEMPSINGLEFGGNDLGGTFPTFLLQMTQLVALSLANTGTTGSIPENIGALSNLYSLNLANNLMVGTLPASLGSLVYLNRLALDSNGFTGIVPILPPGPYVTCSVALNCFSDDSNAVGRCVAGNSNSC